MLLHLQMLFANAPYEDVPKNRSRASQKSWPWIPTKGIPKASEIWGVHWSLPGKDWSSPTSIIFELKMTVNYSHAIHHIHFLFKAVIHEHYKLLKRHCFFKVFSVKPTKCYNWIYIISKTTEDYLYNQKQDVFLKVQHYVALRTQVNLQGRDLETCCSGNGEWPWTCLPSCFTPPPRTPGS